MERSYKRYFLKIIIQEGIKIHIHFLGYISSHGSKAQKSKIKVSWCHYGQIPPKAREENTSCSLQLLVAPGFTWFVKSFLSFRLRNSNS